MSKCPGESTQRRPGTPQLTPAVALRRDLLPPEGDALSRGVLGQTEPPARSQGAPEARPRLVDAPAVSGQSRRREGLRATRSPPTLAAGVHVCDQPPHEALDSHAYP